MPTNVTVSRAIRGGYDDPSAVRLEEIGRDIRRTGVIATPTKPSEPLTCEGHWRAEA